MGSGGREHAMAWAFANDDNVGKVYCAPGNGGTSKIAEIYGAGNTKLPTPTVN